MSSVQERSPLSKDRVLIADDEPYLIRAMSFVLRREGYEVDTALDGWEAMERIKAFNPRTVLLDQTLPGVSPFEILRFIRNRPLTKDAFVIFLSLEGDESQTALSQGADRVFVKPFTPGEIIQSLRNRSIDSKRVRFRSRVSR